MLALVTDAYGGHGGIAQYNRDLLEALVAGGTASEIVVIPRHGPNAANTPAFVHQTAPRPGRIVYVAAAVREALFRRIDAVFCGHLFLAPLALFIAHVKRAKLVVQLHGIEAWERPGFLSRMAVEAADIMLCVSRYTRRRLLDWAAIVPERALVLPNTVDGAFSPGDGSALRAAWGLDGKRVLLSVGRMSARERYKGHDRIIRAIPRLVEAGQDVVYVIAGEGDDRARLQALAEETDIADRVRFMGALDQKALVDAYRMADLFVMPSTGEGFGIAFLEAMACGTPALGLGVGGARDALADGEMGILATEDNLPDALSRVLAQPRPEARALADSVERRFGRARFTVQACAVMDGLRTTA